MTGSKARYIDFCDDHAVPLHLQPWWLDAVCGPDAWGAAVAGRPVAAIWPWYRTRRWGLPVVQLPPLTAYAGPWLPTPDPAQPAHKRLASAQRLLTQLIEQLPDVFFFHQTCRPEIRNALPLLWAGFRQTTRYTYVLPDTGDLPALFAGLKNTLRTDLRRADEQLDVERSNNPEHLFDLHAQSFARKGLRPPYTPAAFRRLHAALEQRGRSAGFVARDRITGIACAALFLAFDAQQAGVLLTGVDARQPHPGALHRLYWEAIRFCSERGLSLDFEGSMNPGIERVFRGFGGHLIPYSRIWK
ncbi:MAG: GNAT family N-acetyltransferase [Lewinellaceae bacterium]|nr:GNAT family N-acetyltransferase [Lewinellaceae bacterium]